MVDNQNPQQKGNIGNAGLLPSMNSGKIMGSIEEIDTCDTEAHSVFCYFANK